jgi:hypothetical protein
VSRFLPSLLFLSAVFLDNTLRNLALLLRTDSPDLGVSVTPLQEFAPCPKTAIRNRGRGEAVEEDVPP